MYVLDDDTKSAKWATYENSLSKWTSQYLGETKEIPKKLGNITLISKYSSRFTYVSEAPRKEIPSMKIEKTRDTVIGNSRYLGICITPQRDINRLEIFTNEIHLDKASANDVELSDFYLSNRRGGKLITHYVSNNKYTDLELVFPKNEILELTIYEASNDLLTNSQFRIPERPKDNIPMPFILNDAILVTKTIRYE